MVVWAVLTPIVLFLFLVPGYVVATYLRHKLVSSDTKERPHSQLLGKCERGALSSYCSTIKPILHEKLQKQASLNIPTPTKSKHLRSSSIVSPFIPNVTSTLKTSQSSPAEIKNVSGQYNCRKHSRQNSIPTSIVVTPQHKPDILETYSPYQITTPSPSSSTDEETTHSPIGNGQSGQKSMLDSNNNGKYKKHRHLVNNSPIHLYSSSFVINPNVSVTPKKIETIHEINLKTKHGGYSIPTKMKIDLPEHKNKS